MKPLERLHRHAATAGLVWLAILAAASLHAAAPEIPDTLFLRDGSVLKGIAVPDPDGAVAVYSNYGCLTMSPGDVLYRLAPAAPQPTVSDIYLLSSSGENAIVTSVRPVPAPESKATTFSLLFPGKVLSVRDTYDQPLAYRSQRAGIASRVIVQYADLPQTTGTLSVSTQVDDAIARRRDGKLEFQIGYTLERDGLASLLLRIPADWKLDSTSPRPEIQLDGLLVWRRQLRRQQSFSAHAVFLPPGTSQ